MIKYRKEEIEQLKKNYKINEELIYKLKIIKKEMNNSSHININNKTIKDDKTDNLKKIIIFLNKISYKNYKKIIDNLNITIDKKEDIIEIVKILIYNAINYYNIQCNTINNEDIYMYSNIMSEIIKNKYKWYYKEDNIYTFRYVLIEHLEREYKKIIEINDKKIINGYNILITTLYIKKILSEKVYEEIIKELIKKNNIISSEILIYILKLLKNNNINKYDEIIKERIKRENDQRIQIIYKILINENKNNEIKKIDEKLDDNINIKKVLEENIYNKNWDEFIEIYKNVCKNENNNEIIDEFINILEENIEEIKIDIPNINIKELKIIFKR